MIRAAWVFMVVQVDLGLVWFRFAPDNAPGFTYANRRARRVDWEILDFFWIEIRGNFSSAGAWVDSHATFPVQPLGVAFAARLAPRLRSRPVRCPFRAKPCSFADRDAKRQDNTRNAERPPHCCSNLQRCKAFASGRSRIAGRRKPTNRRTAHGRCSRRSRFHPATSCGEAAWMKNQKVHLEKNLTTASRSRGRASGVRPPAAAVKGKKP